MSCPYNAPCRVWCSQNLHPYPPYKSLNIICWNMFFLNSTVGFPSMQYSSKECATLITRVAETKLTILLCNIHVIKTPTNYTQWTCSFMSTQFWALSSLQPSSSTDPKQQVQPAHTNQYPSGFVAINICIWSIWYKASVYNKSCINPLFLMNSSGELYVKWGSAEFIWHHDWQLAILHCSSGLPKSSGGLCFNIFSFYEPKWALLFFSIHIIT